MCLQAWYLSSIFVFFLDKTIIYRSLHTFIAKVR